MASMITESEARAAKKPYRAPTLLAYGGLRELTQNGSGAVNENNGKKVCGAIFSVKGGANC